MMRHSRQQRSLGALLACVTMLAGCSHMVTVYSIPPGARIFVNGESVGVAPATFAERSGFRKTFDIRAELDGYEPWTEQHEQKKPSKLLVPSIVGGYVLILPYIGVLWGYQLEDYITISLEPKSPEPAP